jgi:hypothetical protein
MTNGENGHRRLLLCSALAVLAAASLATGAGEQRAGAQAPTRGRTSSSS